MYNLAIQPFFPCRDFSAALPLGALLQSLIDWAGVPQGVALL
jgi:hypothetical protein